MNTDRFYKLISDVSAILWTVSVALSLVVAARIYPANAFLGYVSGARKAELMRGVLIALAAFTLCREAMELVRPRMTRAAAMITALPALAAASVLLARRLFSSMTDVHAAYSFCALIFITVPLCAAVCIRSHRQASADGGEKKRSDIVRTVVRIIMSVLMLILLAICAALFVISGFYTSPLAMVYLSPLITVLGGAVYALGGGKRDAALWLCGAVGTLYCLFYPLDGAGGVISALQFALISLSAIFYIADIVKHLVKRRTV